MSVVVDLNCLSTKFYSFFGSTTNLHFARHIYAILCMIITFEKILQNKIMFYVWLLHGTFMLLQIIQTLDDFFTILFENIAYFLFYENIVCVYVTTSLTINKRWVTQHILSWHRSKLCIYFLLFLTLYRYTVSIGSTHG
jgi:hypothetical protein